MHQYTLSEVSSAAVRYFVEITEKNPDARKEIMVLVGACIAHSTELGAPLVPPRLDDPWMDA